MSNYFHKIYFNFPSKNKDNLSMNKLISSLFSKDFFPSNWLIALKITTIRKIIEKKKLKISRESIFFLFLFLF